MDNSEGRARPDMPVALECLAAPARRAGTGSPLSWTPLRLAGRSLLIFTAVGAGMEAEVGMVALAHTGFLGARGGPGVRVMGARPTVCRARQDFAALAARVPVA